ncbi:MAG: DUF4340 domain-containing protein [Planctomycetota bacterium]|nr:MAG: DUF4340 domain-containing protein [Planctomycetota bacterium]
MNSKSLLTLAVLTVIVAAAAFGARYLRDQEAAPADLEAYFFPDLQAQLNEVNQVSITQGENSFAVKRQGEQWILAGKGGYPAKFESVKKALSGLAYLKPVEPKTSEPSLYERLGVQDPDSSNQATLVRLENASGTEVAAVILGEQKWQGGSSRLYVRKPQEAQAWLVEGDLRTAADLSSWYERQILNVQRDRIQAGTIEQADGSRLEGFRKQMGEFAFDLRDLPEGWKLKFDSSMNFLASALEYVNMDDVQAAADFEKPESSVRASFQCYDGLVMEVETYQKEEKSFVTFRASFDPTLRPEEEASEKDEAEDEATGASEAELSSAEEVQKEVEELNQKLGAWVFELPSYKAANFTKKLEDVAEPLPPEESPSDSSEAAAPPGEEPPVFEIEAPPPPDEDGAEQQPEAPAPNPETTEKPVEQPPEPAAEDPEPKSEPETPPKEDG